MLAINDQASSADDYSWFKKNEKNLYFFIILLIFYFFTHSVREPIRTLLYFRLFIYKNTFEHYQTFITFSYFPAKRYLLK